jgi:uncharacterized delta-60 repeat protein
MRKAGTLRNVWLLAILGVCCLAGAALADRPSLRLDPSFGSDGVAQTGGAHLESGFDRSVLVADSHGRLLILGATRSSFTVSRFLANGRLDKSFGDDGVAEVVVPGLTSPPVPEEGQGGAGEPEPTALAVQPDGAILLVGTYHGNFGPGPVSVVARLRPDGRVDAGFGGPDAGGEAAGQAVPRDPNVLAIAAQGRRILIAGGGGGGYVSRLDHAGRLDPSFGPDRSGRVDLPPPAPGQTRPGKGAIASLVLRRDGGIYAGGYHKGRFLVARLARDGSLVRGFGEQGWTETPLSSEPGCHCSLGRSLARDRRGRLLLVGTVSSGIASLGPAFGRVRETAKIAIARFRPDGSLDGDFGARGIVRTRVASAAYGHDVVVAHGGSIYVAATSSGKESPVAGSGSRFTLLRYGPEGRRQSLLASRLGARGATAWDTQVARSGRIIVGGTAIYGPQRRVRGVVARFQP